VDFAFTEEQEMFRRAIREFAKNEIVPLVAEAEAKEEFPLGLLPKAGSLGYLCPRVPEEYGGGGMDMVSTCIMNEEIARIDLGISEVFMGAGYIAPIILNYGTEEQKQKYLASAVRGEKIWAFALTESVGGSNPAANETTATRKGDRYILNGSKTFITSAAIADYLLVIAYTDKAKGPREGMSAFILERNTPGFTTTKMKKVGSLPSSEGDLFFDNVEIPAANLVGKEGTGWHNMFAFIINEGRITYQIAPS